MNRSTRNHIFWNDASPLACLAGAALLLTASDRLAHAIIVTGALVWVYCLSSLAARTGARIFPKRIRNVLVAFIASFITSLYLLLLWILSPLCALETFFVIVLIPMFCMTSNVFKRLETFGLTDVLRASVFEALSLGVLIIIFAIIREPLGFLSLSLPGGAQGLVLIFSSETKSFLPVYLAATSSGALLLLGYSFGLYRYLKAMYMPGEEKQ